MQVISEAVNAENNKKVNSYGLYLVNLFRNVRILANYRFRSYGGTSWLKSIELRRQSSIMPMIKAVNDSGHDLSIFEKNYCDSETMS